MRRPSPLHVLLMVILVAGFQVPASDVGSQPDASPEPTFPIAPDLTQCTVEPRSPESIAALLGTPVADASLAPAQLPEPFVAEVPIGQPVEEVIWEHVVATVTEFYACFNAGDSRRAFALVSDMFLQRYAENNRLTTGQIDMLIADAEPVLVEVQVTILAITDVTILTDGRAGAFVVVTSEWRGPDTAYMLFVQQGKRWLLDEAIGFLTA